MSKPKGHIGTAMGRPMRFSKSETELPITKSWEKMSQEEREKAIARANAQNEAQKKKIG